MRAICTALLALVAALVPARASLAVEVPLPGELELSLHGHFETTMALAGDDSLLGDTGFSQFRHVLQLEAELPAFPGGVGPFESVLFWTRFAASYDCLYEGACGLSGETRSYGTERREAERLPRHFGRGARPRRSFVGGLHGRPITALPELTLRERQRELSPDGRLRFCGDDADGFGRANPAPYGALCGFTDPSPLTGPHHGLRGANSLVFYSFSRVHAGAFALPARFSLLRVARSRIGEERYAELLAKLLPDESGRIAGGLSASQESLRRGWLRAGELALAEGMRAGSFDEAIPELLATRSEPDLFNALALANEPGLLHARWGSGRIAGSQLAFSPELGLRIRPTGYFRAPSLDLVSELAEGVLAGLPQGAGIPEAAFREFAGAANPFVSRAEFERGALPLFVGPDGVSGSEDDLPSSRTGVIGLDAPIASDSSFSSHLPFRYARVGKVKLDREVEVELYGVLEPVQLRRRACEFLTRRPAVAGEQPCSLEAAGVDSLPELERVGCRLAAEQWTYQRAMGFNADGHCIHLNVTALVDRGGVDPRVLVALGERRFRPGDAALEPSDLTDFRLHAENGSSLPARPLALGRGLAFDTAGAARFRRSHRRSVANLGLDFDEDALRWGHGASDDEHEFREGYVELEGLGRQLTARVGKLVMVWGKTDVFRNQDRWNPLDLSVGPIGSLEDARIGQWGAQLWIQPRSWLRWGRLEDLRLELALLFDDFESDDRGRCGQPGSLPTACLLETSALMAGFTGLGLIGQASPYRDQDALERSDVGVRLEGRYERFSFAISDFWGWDDAPLLRSVHAYERRVDPVTGAPVRAGGAGCLWRAAGGGSTAQRAESVGPNGIAGDDDDVIPSAGGCLLWDEPPAPAAAQKLRAESAIAESHTVNQTLFHLLCTLGFSSDEGFCASDALNSPQRFGPVMAILGGGPLEPFAFPELGLDRIRRRGVRGSDPAASARERDLLEFELVETGPPALRPVNEFRSAGVDLYAQSGLGAAQREEIATGALSAQQAALLGCGPAYASPCDERERDEYARRGSRLLNSKLERRTLSAADFGMSAEQFAAVSDSDRIRIVRLGQGTIGASLGRTTAQLGGGIDLANADASVLLQESSILKAWAPGMFVGTVRTPRGLEWLPGINTQADGTPENDFRRSAFRLPGESTPFSVRRALALSPDERFRLSAAAFDAARLDGWIEPMPWELDPEWARRGVVVFAADPAHPFGDPAAWSLPASDPERARRLVGSTSNRFRRLADGTPYGEYCGALSQYPGADHPFARGCTELEIVSANLERLNQGAEIVGSDREFDPPESIAELGAWIAHRNRVRPADALVGDPISGPDGIFARNFWADLVLAEPLPGDAGLDDVQDVLALRGSRTGQGKGTYVSALRPADLALPEAERVARRREFFASYDPRSCPNSARACHLKLSLDTASESGLAQGGTELVAALPISFPVDESPAGGGPAGRVQVNLLKLELERPLDLARLFAGERVHDADSGKFVVMNSAQRGLLLGPGPALQGSYQDLDADRIPDLDRDLDGVWDGLDDFTPGPISDDNLLCGSGVPGDLFQEALQYEPYRRSERPGTPRFQAAFADGLPPRSPVFCSSATSLVGSTGASLPIRRAGGDGRYGRLQFAWHEGQQVALDFQKTNVLGFALDFSEEVLQASWSLELSYTADRAFTDAGADDLISDSDELLVSLSLDRSLFLNALNRSSSVLFNAQVFARYLADYRDGYALHTPAALSTFLTLSAQTSYFQGRAQPGATLIWFPQESQAGFLSELRYSWTDRITTTLGITHLFGSPATARTFLSPIAPGLSSPDDVDSTAWGRGLTALLNRDELWLRFRYAW